MMGLFSKKPEPQKTRTEELQEDLEVIALNVKTAIDTQDDYWLNELIDQAHKLQEEDPALIIPDTITKAEAVMKEYGRRIENIKEKYTMAQYLEAQAAAAKDEAEDEEEDAEE